jgi:hypothetical protein
MKTLVKIPTTSMRLKKRGKGMVAVPQGKLPALSAEKVRETLERVRRQRTRSIQSSPS